MRVIGRGWINIGEDVWLVIDKNEVLVDRSYSEYTIKRRSWLGMPRPCKVSLSPGLPDKISVRRLSIKSAPLVKGRDAGIIFTPAQQP